MILNKCDKSQQFERTHIPGRQYIAQPKSLAERLQWMSENLPGFREELEAVNEAEQRARARAANAGASSAPNKGSDVREVSK